MVVFEGGVHVVFRDMNMTSERAVTDTELQIDHRILIDWRLL